MRVSHKILIAFFITTSLLSAQVILPDQDGKYTRSEYQKPDLSYGVMQSDGDDNLKVYDDKFFTLFTAYRVDFNTQQDETQAIIQNEFDESQTLSQSLYDSLETLLNNSFGALNSYFDRLVSTTIFQYVIPPQATIPSGALPTIDRVLNTENNLIDSGWINVEDYSSQSFHVISDVSVHVFLLNASDNQGSNWVGADQAFLTSQPNQPADLSSKFFDDYFRIIVINTSGTTLTEVSIRSRGGEAAKQPLDIALEQPIFSFFPAILVQSVIKGLNELTEQYEAVSLSGNNNLKVAIGDRTCQVNNRQCFYINQFIDPVSSTTGSTIHTVTAGHTAHVQSFTVDCINTSGTEGRWKLRNGTTNRWGGQVPEQAFGAGGQASSESPPLPQPILFTSSVNLFEASGDLQCEVSMVLYEEPI